MSLNREKGETLVLGAISILPYPRAPVIPVPLDILTAV